MDTLINDIMGPPRRRSHQSKKPVKSPDPETRPVQRSPKTTLPGTFDTEATSSATEVASKATSPTEVPLPPEQASEAIALQEAASSDTPAPAELPLDREVSKAEGVASTELPPNEEVFQAEERSTLEEETDQVPTLSILEPIPVFPSHSALLVGIAGATASGKTVLSHLLTLVLPSSTPSFIIHLNDFLIPQHFLSPNKSGVFDTDCREAIDFARLLRVINYVKREGTLPPGYSTNRDEESERELARSLVDQQVIEEVQEMIVQSQTFKEGQPVVVISGFLLYHEAEIRDLLDVKLFLRVRKEQAQNGRFEKLSYTTEGADHEFWKSRRYFDQVVWPNYVDEHRPLFKGGNVEGMPLFGLCAKLNITMQPQLDMNIEQTLRWAATSISSGLQGPNFRQTRDLEQDGDLDPEVSFLGKYEACDCCEGWLGRIRKVLYDFV